jgi:hypothetical protein
MADIEQRMTETISVDITITDADHHDQSTLSLVLPAAELANPESLLKHCKGLMASSSSKGAIVAVDFPERDGGGDSLFSGESDNSELIDLPKPDSVDPLLHSIPIYSTWYFQPPLQNLDSLALHVTARYTNEELHMRQLESEIARLEFELRDLNSTRPFDDIQDELNACRSQLRRLKWKRWVPWW